MGTIGERLATGAPGIHQGFLPVGCMSSGAAIAIPWVAMRGAAPGPTLWLNGQVHGDEINGMLAALRFVRGLDAAQLQGHVVVTATANPQALDLRRKRNPYDELDLDQTFPGNASGLVSERLAHTLIGEIRGTASMLVSLHTMNPLFDSRAYTVYKVHPDSGVSEEAQLRATSFFHPNVACRQDVGGRGELPGNISGGIDYQCLAAGIPSFMLELGAGSRYEPHNVALAERGFGMLARHLGILHDGVALEHAAEVRRVTRRHWITFDHGGLFVPEVEAGATVEAGAVLGRTLNLFGECIETVTSRQPGVVIGLRRDPVVHTGERTAFFATEWNVHAVSL